MVWFPPIPAKFLKFHKEKYKLQTILEKLQPVYAKWIFLIYMKFKDFFKKSCNFEVVKFRGYLSFIDSTFFKFRGTVLQQTNAYWHCWLTQWPATFAAVSDHVQPTNCTPPTPQNAHLTWTKTEIATECSVHYVRRLRLPMKTGRVPQPGDELWRLNENVALCDENDERAASL